MAYVNVKDWSADQVNDWLRGLDNAVLPYFKTFLNNGVDGHQLLNLRVDDLEPLGVHKLGHQEIILQAVQQLRHFHYELDTENLQRLALHLNCAASSLNAELRHYDKNEKRVKTIILVAVHNVITHIKPLACWLGRAPFSGIKEYKELKTDLLQLGFTMATYAHRDIFSDDPVQSLREISEKLMKLSETILQVMDDPMILQPASLDLATLKKKDQEWGFYIVPSSGGEHEIVSIKYGSPAHLSTKIEEGDEIVQVNYQTVVGWEREKVIMLLQELPPEIVLTLKKRPRHTKVYGQIYMKPYRLPSKKRSGPFTRWNQNLPSPLLPILDFAQFQMPKPVPAVAEIEIETSESSESEIEPTIDDPPRREYPPKPLAVLQRRNTIAGITSKEHLSVPPKQYWRQWKNASTKTMSSAFNLRSSKDADSFFGFTRSTTVIGLGTSGREEIKKPVVRFEEQLSAPAKELERTFSYVSLNSFKDDNSIEYIDESEDLQDRSSMKNDDSKNTTKTSSKIDRIIQKFEMKADNVQAEPKPTSPIYRAEQCKNRGKLDKSFSTPVYDLGDVHLNEVQEIVVPPRRINRDAAETKENCTGIAQQLPTVTEIKKPVPPKPPPRTVFNTGLGVASAAATVANEKKSLAVPSVPSIKTTVEGKAATTASDFGLLPSSIPPPIVTRKRKEIAEIPKINLPKNDVGQKPQKSSFVTRAIGSTKGKSKKKNSLLLKKRKVSVNDVSPGEMQGFLYQRLRSKQNQSIHWEKRWFVLSQNALYAFKTNESTKAECYIALSGFTVTEALEVKSRDFAFKVYHTGTAFYFAADNRENLTTWLECLSMATLNSIPGKSSNKTLDEIQYSETDDDSDSNSNRLKSSTEKQSDGPLNFHSLKKLTSKKRDFLSGSTSLDRKRFFNKTNNQKSTPVPTPQYRSYRKIASSTTIGNFTSHVPNFANKMEISQIQSKNNVSVDSIPLSLQHESSAAKDQSLRGSSLSVSSDHHNVTYPMPKKKNKASDNFVTLAEIMMRESEGKPEEFFTFNSHSIYPDVVYGEIPERFNKSTKGESSCFGKRSGSTKSSKQEAKSNNSLPRTSAKTDSALSMKLRSSSSKSLHKEKSYEMIYRPTQVTADVQFAQNRLINAADGSYNSKSSSPRTPYSGNASGNEEKFKYDSKYVFELNLDEMTTGDAERQSGGKLRHFFRKDKKSPKALKEKGFAAPSSSSSAGGGNVNVAVCAAPSAEHSFLFQEGASSIDYSSVAFPSSYEHHESYSSSTPKSLKTFKNTFPKI